MHVGDADMTEGKEVRLFSTYKVVPHDNKSIPADPSINASKNPSLVISVHGFNNQRDTILPIFLEGFKVVNGDSSVDNHDVVCIGYRWPSEGIFTTIRT